MISSADGGTSGLTTVVARLEFGPESPLGVESERAGLARRTDGGFDITGQGPKSAAMIRGWALVPREAPRGSRGPRGAVRRCRYLSAALRPEPAINGIEKARALDSVSVSMSTVAVRLKIPSRSATTVTVCAIGTFGS